MERFKTYFPNVKLKSLLNISVLDYDKVYTYRTIKIKLTLDTWHILVLSSKAST